MSKGEAIRSVLICWRELEVAKGNVQRLERKLSELSKAAVAQGVDEGPYVLEGAIVRFDTENNCWPSIEWAEEIEQ